MIYHSQPGLVPLGARALGGSGTTPTVTRGPSLAGTTPHVGRSQWRRAANALSWLAMSLNRRLYDRSLDQWAFCSLTRSLRTPEPSTTRNEQPATSTAKHWSPSQPTRSHPPRLRTPNPLQRTHRLWHTEPPSTEPTEPPSTERQLDIYAPGVSIRSHPLRAANPAPDRGGQADRSPKRQHICRSVLGSDPPPGPGGPPLIIAVAPLRTGHLQYE